MADSIWGGLGKLAIASWLLTNTMFLLCSRVPFMTWIL